MDENLRRSGDVHDSSEIIGLGLTKRCLIQHDADTTCFTQDEFSVISETDSWTDGTVLLDSPGAASNRRHSRRPRVGRRAKSRKHQEEYVQQSSLAARESFGTAVDPWPQSLATLLECLEEDLTSNICDSGPCMAFGDPLSSAREEHGSSNVSSGDVSNSAEVVEETFSVRVIKPDRVSMGLSLQQHGEPHREGLLIERVLPGGVVELWNAKCPESTKVAQYGKIVSINGFTDAERMLEACRSNGKLALQLLRGPFSEEAFDEPQAPAQPQEHNVIQQEESEKDDEEEEDEAKAKQKSAQEEERKQLVLSSGAADIQRLLAERFARSLSTRS